MKSPTPFFSTISRFTFGNRITEAPHQDFVRPTEKSETGGELSGDSFDPAFGTLGLQSIVGSVNIIRVKGESKHHSLFTSCLDQIRISLAGALIIGIGMHHMDAVRTTPEQE